MFRSPHQRGSDLVTFPTTGTDPGSVSTAAIAFDGTRSSTTTGGLIIDLYFAANIVLRSMTLPLTMNVGSSEHHSTPASALPAESIETSSAKTKTYPIR